MISSLLASQLARPSPLLGPVLARLWNRRNVTLNDAAFTALALAPQDRVLEVGFGGGYLLDRMAAVVTGGFIAGVDVSPAMVAFCQRRFATWARSGRMELKCAEAEQLPFPPAYFDKVCSVNSIFYWANPEQALTEIQRVLEADGCLVLCLTDKASLANRDFARHGLGLFDAEDIRQLLAKTGFALLSVVRGADPHREFLTVLARKP